MRKAESYRGARRNDARQNGKLAEWRLSRAAHDANMRTDIIGRQQMANDANKAVALALAGAGPLAGFSVANHAYLKFYSAQKRTRVVNRIIGELRTSARRHAQSSASI